MVRQLFELGIIQSGFWHQFALTTHSPIGEHPENYGLVPEYESISFAHNDIQFKDKTGIDHDRFSFGLKKSLFNFMHGVGFELPVNEWFDFKVPRTKISPEFIQYSIESEPFPSVKQSAKPIWLGGTPLISNFTNTKKGKAISMAQWTMHLKDNCVEISLSTEQSKWFLTQIEALSIFSKEQRTITQLKSDYETHFNDFELFWYSLPIVTLRENGLLLV
jgi:hypothetical protein